MKSAALFWSGGKDASMALWNCLQAQDIKVDYLITTLSSKTKRISMHGVSEQILDAQANSIGIPLLKMWVEEASNTSYEASLNEILNDVKTLGVDTVVFGDIFLEDLKNYRDGLLAKAGLQGYYPLWDRDTTELMKFFDSSGFQANICCLNRELLPESLLGGLISFNILKKYPIDPCGENGEFHTLCWDGPIFSKPIELRPTIIIEKDLPLSNSKTVKFAYQEFDLNL